MTDPATALLTVVVTGLEEAVMRCTLTLRDDAWEWINGMPAELSEAEQMFKKAVSLENSDEMQKCKTFRNSRNSSSAYDPRQIQSISV